MARNVMKLRLQLRLDSDNLEDLVGDSRNVISQMIPALIILFHPRDALPLPKTTVRDAFDTEKHGMVYWLT